MGRSTRASDKKQSEELQAAAQRFLQLLAKKLQQGKLTTWVRLGS